MVCKEQSEQSNRFFVGQEKERMRRAKNLSDLISSEMSSAKVR